MSTIFGGDTGISYADLKRRKAMVEALAARSRQAPRNVGEGLTAIGNALAAKVGEYRNEKKQAKLDARNSELIASLSTGKPGTPFVPNNPAVAPPNAPNTPGTPDPNVTPAAVVDGTPDPAMNPPSDATGQEAYPGAPDPVVNTAGPAKIEGTFGKILAKHEGAGRFDTLFAHSQKPGGRFAGVDVTKMTIDQALEFAKPSGEYGQWVKAKLGSMGHRARVATPMGALQIVGTTLRNTAKEMGLPGDTLMTPEVQVAMANHLARKRISKPGLSQAGKRRELRSEWEGFKNASNAELDAVIAEVETGKPVTAANFATGEGVGYTPNTGAAAPVRGSLPTEGTPDPNVAATLAGPAGDPVAPVGGEPTGPVATGPARIAQLLAVMADPSLSPQNRQMVQMLLGEEVRASRGMSAAERERFDYTKTTNDRNYALNVETAERNAAAAEERARLANERFEFDRTNAEAQRAAQAAMAEAKAARDAAEIARKQANSDRSHELAEKKYASTVDETGKRIPTTSIQVGSGEKAFTKETAKAQAKMFTDWTGAGVNAKAELGSINELEGLLKGGIGGTSDNLQLWFQNKFGINVGVGGEIEAFGALINRLIPSQRPPGSGVMSDKDVEMFRNSLPQLVNSPEGNKLIVDTMRAMVDYKIKVGEIAAQAVAGRIDRNKATEMIYALPDPLTAFKASRPDRTPPIPGTPGAVDGAAVLDKAAVPPIPEAYRDDPVIVEAWPDMMPEERKLFMGQ